MQIGVPPMAGADAKRAIELKPTALRIYPLPMIIGHILYGLGRYGEAITYLFIEMEIEPRDHKSLDLRGDCYHRQGQFDTALADFEEAVRLYPDNQEYLTDVENTKREQERIRRLKLQQENPRGE